MLSPDKDGCVIEFVAVERIRCCDALSPADTEICFDFEQENVFLILGEERGSKWTYQWQGASVDGDSLDPHY